MTAAAGPPGSDRLAARAVADLTAAGVDRATLVALEEHLALLRWAGPAAAGALDGGADARSLGELHQDQLDDEHRRQRGVHYTPRAVAAALVRRVLGPTGSDGAQGAVPSVCDPSCGGGAFLVAVADHLALSGIDPAAALEALHGLDLDPLAVEVARAALVVWAARAGVDGAALVAAAAGHRSTRASPGTSRSTSPAATATSAGPTTPARAAHVTRAARATSTASGSRSSP